MFTPGPTELVLIVGVIVLLFGANKIPEFARNIGRAKAELRRGEQELKEEDETDG